MCCSSILPKNQNIHIFTTNIYLLTRSSLIILINRNLGKSKQIIRNKAFPESVITRENESVKIEFLVYLITFERQNLVMSIKEY